MTEQLQRYRAMEVSELSTDRWLSDYVHCLSALVGPTHADYQIDEITIGAVKESEDKHFPTISGWYLGGDTPRRRLWIMATLLSEEKAEFSFNMAMSCLDADARDVYDTFAKENPPIEDGHKRGNVLISPQFHEITMDFAWRHGINVVSVPTANADVRKVWKSWGARDVPGQGGHVRWIVRGQTAQERAESDESLIEAFASIEKRFKTLNQLLTSLYSQRGRM